MPADYGVEYLGCVCGVEWGWFGFCVVGVGDDFWWGVWGVCVDEVGGHGWLCGLVVCVEMGVGFYLHER